VREFAPDPCHWIILVVGVTTYRSCARTRYRLALRARFQAPFTECAYGYALCEFMNAASETTTNEAVVEKRLISTKLQHSGMRFGALEQ